MRPPRASRGPPEKPKLARASSGPMPRLRCFVSGLVQGVFFRGNTQRQAYRLGLRGWVRNLPDGRVEAVLEGPRDKLEAMVAWLHRGPPMARVERVETREEPEEGLQGFELRYA